MTKEDLPIWIKAWVWIESLWMILWYGFDGAEERLDKRLAFLTQEQIRIRRELWRIKNGTSKRP